MPRLAVVGGGIMGTNHTRIASTLRGAELVAVVDPDPARRDALATSAGCRAAATVAEILDDIDAAIVAAPSGLHRPIGLELIRAGKHVLIEKPIAVDIADGEALVAAAAEAGVVLMVGHVERFNPAVLELGSILDDVVHLRATRISPYSPRVTVGVVLDLMIHDLDIARSVVRSPVRRVQASARVVRSSTEDLVCALLTFENGVTADLVASRIGQQKIRELQITQGSSFVAVDLVRQDITINRVNHSEYVSDEGARYRQTGMVEIPFLDRRGEPLQLEQQEFVRAITEHDRPLVTGEDGVEALRLAQWVLDASRAD